MKKAIYRVLALAILAGGGWYGYRWYKNLPSHQEQIATTKVQRGDVVIRAFSRGELHAVRSVTLMAPNLNGTVQVTALAPMGALAKEKDLVVEYDDSERLAALDEDQMALQQTDEQIKGAKANMGITQSQDALTLMKTRYAVRSAQLAVQKNDVIDLIDAKKNLLALEEAKRAVTQLETDIAARQAQNDSILAVYAEQRNRNLLDIRREQQRIAQTKALAEITGLVSIRQNRAGNFNFGQVMPDIREGDTLQPGMPVADILDLSEVEVWAKVGELDRANLKEGQDAILQLDSMPDKQFHGQIKTLSGTATADVFSGDPAKKFDVVFSVDMRGLLSDLGMKPGDVERVMATAEANAKKNVNNTASTLFASLQLPPVAAPGVPGAAAAGFAPMGQEQGADDDQNQSAGGRGRRGGGGGGNRGGGMGGRGQGGDTAGGMSFRGGAPGSAPGGVMAGGMGGRGQGGGMAGDMSGRGADMAGGRGQSGGMGGRGADAGAGRGGAGSAADANGGRGQGGGGRGRGRSAADLMAVLGRDESQFSEDERKNAKLPLPPEQDSQVQVLLRPGLLADVQITVESLPNVLHVPEQAVFQKGGKPVVYVKQKNGRFVAREVQLAEQSESMMVLKGGVEAGEIVALSDPTADKSAKKEEKKSESNPMSSMPGGK
jgi:multidrug resistance efflux pump